MRKHKLLPAVSGVLSLILCLSLAMIPVRAEEIAGYHEQTTTEEEATDTWYAVGRGTYLSSGTSSIKVAGSKKVSISGSTNANSICDELRLALYLYESSNNKNYGNIGIYHFTRENAAIVTGSKTDISVTKGWYYYVSGSHTAIEGSKVETCSSETDALIAQ